MNSYLSQWVTDLASICSIAGFVATVFLFLEARKIRNSFLRKVRIPEIANDLDALSSGLISDLKNYKDENRGALEKILKAVAILESTLSKIPADHRDKIIKFIDFTKNSIQKSVDEERMWTVSTELSGVVTYLQQIAKDTRLD